MKAEELRSMTAEQLGVKVWIKITDVKHDIARVMTVLREKNA